MPTRHPGHLRVFLLVFSKPNYEYYINNNTLLQNFDSGSLWRDPLVNPRGSKLWRIKYRINGVERKPTPGIIS